MTTIVFLFAVIILIGGITICVKPRYVTGIFNRYKDSFGFHVFAIIVRIIFGIALIFAATDSKYPFVLQVLGVLMILAVLVLTIMGRERFKHLIKWALSIEPNTQRALGFAGVLFGGFLLFAIQ